MRLPICGCGRVMNCTKTGLSVLLHTEDGLEYQLWASDEYTCPACSAKVALIQSALPIAEHFQGGFEQAKRAASTPDGRVKMMRAYYGDVPNSNPNIAGVSTVDSTTTAAEDAQHHGNSTPS